MCLIDAGEVSLWKVFKVVDEIRLKALWCKKEEIDLALLHHRDDLLFILSIYQGTYASCRQVLGKMRQLVQHQRD